ncbi:MAG: PLP-dependent transferase, partial [Micromonosporaceae bacterium]
PAVEAVYWPGRTDHPDHAIARQHLDGFGGVLAFELKGGREAGHLLSKRVELAFLALSLGGVETVLSHPASTTHRQLDSAALAAAGIGDGLIRIAVGIEEPEDLWADLAQALPEA